MGKCVEYKASKEERYLRDLLALVHRDGGEHNTEVGLWESTKDARKRIEISINLIRECIEALECGTEQNYADELIQKLRIFIGDL